MASRSILFTVAVALILSAMIALAFRPSLYPPYDEGRDYVAIANGNYSGIYNFYGGRVLHPLAVRFTSRIEGVPIDARAFRSVSVAALIGFFCVLGICYGLEHTSAGSLWLLLLASAPLVDAYRNYYWHDLFYAALCALFFLALRASPWMGLPIVFLLYLTRESTIVLVAALFLVAALRRQWKFCVAVLAVGLAAMEVQSALVARGLPNHHGIPTMTLDFLRIPYNFAYNICGVEIWTNTIGPTLPPPIWTIHLPSWLHLGHIRQVGYSGFFWQNPARTLLTLSTAFGILPLAVVRGVARDGKRLLRERFDIVTAFVYGGLMFLLAPLVGTLPTRYVLYAWPVFWLFGVGVLNAAFPGLQKRIQIVALSLFVAWVPAIVRISMGPSISGPESVSGVTPSGVLISLVIVTVAYVCGWQVLHSPEAAVSSPSR